MSSFTSSMTDREKIEQTIATLDAQRFVLGDEVVDRAIASLRQELQSKSQKVAAQRKQVTVLFADLVGFTALTSPMDAEEVQELVNAIWDRLDSTILAHGGTIDKHLGDGLMALFGAPVAQEDDAERAVLAGLAMQAELAAWISLRGGGNLLPDALAALHMRVGINTGSVLFGPVGSRGEITAMGDTVNMASRLEGAAAAGRVLVGEETWRQVAGRFDATPLVLQVKGRNEPLTAFLVEAEKSASRRTSGRGVAGVETRTIGREAELEQLRGIFAQVVAEKQAKVVTVMGEAGIGKSRLLQEFTGWLAEQPRPHFLMTARAGMETERHPYWLVREAIAAKLEISNSTPAPLARERLIAGLAGIDDEGDSGMAEFIGHLIGLDFSKSSQIQGVLGDAQQIRFRAFQYLARLFAAVSRQEPVVVLLEDIHWADAGSLDVIEYLGRECADLPVLILCLTRPSLLERRPLWGNNPGADVRLPLEPLSDSQSGQLVGEILRHVREIPSHLMRTIIESASGNAFYIEELIKVLIEDGVIVPAPDEWRVHGERMGDLRVPPTLTAVLQARLDRLPPKERELLQRAAVVGKLFWSSALHFVGRSGHGEIPGGEALVSASGEREQSALLEALVEREFVQKSRASTFDGTAEYRFRHAILHEVVYESVLLRRRRLYHQRVAEWLIEESQDRVAEFAGLVGEHFAKANRAVDAALWFAKAGHQARETYLPDVALDFYVKALDQSPDASQQIDLYFHLGEMLFWQARYDEAVTAFQAMDRLAEQAGDSFARSRAWNQLSVVQGRQGDHREAIRSAEQAAALGRLAGQVPPLIQALLTKASSLLLLGQSDEAEGLCQEALTLSQRSNLPVEIAQTKNLLGRICDARGEYARSMQFKEEALELFRGLGDRRKIGWMLHNMGVVILLRGDYRAAVSVYRDALQIAKEIGDRDWEMAVLVNLGSAYVGLKNFPAAADTLQSLLSMNDTDFYFTSLVYGTLAEALLGLGRVEQAKQAVKFALDNAEMEEALEFLGYSWRVQGQIYSQTGSPGSAEECFSRSAEIFTSIGAEAENARTLREWALHLSRIGNCPAYLSKWQESRSIFEKLSMDIEIRRHDQLLVERFEL